MISICSNDAPCKVQYKTIGEAAQIKRGVRITKSEISSEGQYAVISGGASPMGYCDKYNRDENTITISQYGTAGYVDWQDEKFWANDVCYSVYPRDGVVNKYLYYVLKSKEQLFYQLRTDAIPACLPRNVLESVKIPIPPIEVQNEMVRVLDSFINLSAELSAELSARKCQYEFYRDRLLSFDALNLKTNCNLSSCCSDNIKTVALKEIASYSKTRIDAESCLNSYVSVETLLPDKGGIANRLPTPTEKTVISFQKWDILLGNIRPYLKKIWLSDRDGGTNGDVLVIQIKDVKTISPKYLYYVLSSDSFFHYDVQNCKGAKMPRGDKTAIMNYMVPIPPIEIQNKIVQTLDVFEGLCNDLCYGIPAEIEARRKQYEYYRDRLLSFEEVP